MTNPDDPRTEFIRAALWHGTLERAQSLLAAQPGLPESSIHVAAILGDDAGVRRFLRQDPGTVATKSAPYGGDPLVYLCLSKYLRLDSSRSDSFLRAATALLDAGADPNGGFLTTGQHPEFETALYGAAGVAHHAEMTRLLLERGADPNDEEVVYHSPESHDNAAMKLVVETGRVRADNLALMLMRKHDWHDYDGAKWLLEHGADPNQAWKRGFLAIHHAIVRDNSEQMIRLLLDHGADPTRPKDGVTAIARAASRGRGDLLALFRERGFALDLEGVDELIAACALNDGPWARAIIERKPGLQAELIAQGGQRLTEFAGTGNTEGVRLLLELGVPVGALYEGDGYWDVAPKSTALHMAAWKGLTSTVKLLLERGAEVDPRDGKGRTPLVLAVKATVDSYWTERRTPETVRALLQAGASPDEVAYPSGYAEVDALLRPGRTGNTRVGN